MGLCARVTVREFNVRYRYLSRQLHPENYDSLITGTTPEEVVDLFKLINNTHQLLLDTISR